jgi:hypothetical protein
MQPAPTTATAFVSHRDRSLDNPRQSAAIRSGARLATTFHSETPRPQGPRARDGFQSMLSWSACDGFQSMLSWSAYGNVICGSAGVAATRR